MRKTGLVILFILAVIGCYSQTDFEKGYYIDQSGNKIEGLIRNEDWESNPVSINFKLSESSEKQTLSINAIREFSITDNSKYRKFTVLIDRSPDAVSELDNQRDPIYSEETLLLKVLVEGKANLYVYNDRGLTRFFFDTDSLSVEQLIYKSYINSQNHIGVNSLFRQQLLENLKCPEVSFSDIQKTDYKKNELVAIFTTYNKSLNAEPVIYLGNKNRDFINVSIKPGIQYASLYMQNDFEYFDHMKFDGKNNFRLALDLEFILPFNNNKIALYLQPAFQHYKSSGTTYYNPQFNEIIDAKIDFQSLELPAGIRYYFFLNKNSKIYLNFDMIFDFKFDSNIAFHKRDFRILNYEVKSNTNFSAGLGYKYKRFLVEFNWQTSQNLVKTIPTWVCEYKSCSFSLGYTLF